ALPALVLTPFVLGLLSDRPADAAWLRMPEKDWLKQRLEKDSSDSSAIGQHRFLDLFRSVAMISLGFVYFGITGFAYGLRFFLPQIVKPFGLSIVQTGFVSALPFVAGLIGMTWWGRRSDRLAERRFHLLLPLALATIGLAGSTFVGPPVLKLALLSVATFGVFSALPVFWTVPPTLLTPATAAAGIAFINAVGNISGFVNPYAMGIIKD